MSRAMTAARTAGEVLARHVWFRLPEATRLRLAESLQGRRGGGDAPPSLPLERLQERIRELVPGPDPLLMVHSSADALNLLDESGVPLPGMRAARDLLGSLQTLVGPEGTLCMPTHPLYRDDPGYLFDKSDLVLSYQPERTPSSVGLLTEFFRRGPQTLRSAHPLSSLAARGPRGEALLRDNLNDREPLPHGVDSGYHRFCREGGTVLGIGIDLLKYLTILHVPEEVLDADWPVRGFFYRRRFRVETGDAEPREVVVRERRPEFVRALSHARLRRDLLGEGILVETGFQGVRLDVCHAGPFYHYIAERQKKSPYPYLLPALARIGTPPRLPASS